MRTSNTPRKGEDHLLRAREAARLVGISTTTIRRKVDPRSSQFDARFPAPFRPGTATAVWRESELLVWLESTRVARPEVAW